MPKRPGTLLAFSFQMNTLTPPRVAGTADRPSFVARSSIEGSVLANRNASKRAAIDFTIFLVNVQSLFFRIADILLGVDPCFAQLKAHPQTPVFFATAEILSCGHLDHSYEL